jgi:hypothetical protein
VYISRALAEWWGLEVQCVSNEQISIWARTCRWCCGLYPGGMLHLSGQYLPISWVHKRLCCLYLNRRRAEKMLHLSGQYLPISWVHERLCCLYLNRRRAEKNKTKGELPSFWIFDLGVKGINLTIHMPKTIFLGCIKFRRSVSADRTIPSSYPSAFIP